MTTWRALQQACCNYWGIAVRRTAILCTDKKTYSIAVNVCNPSLSNDCGIGDVYGTFTKSIGVSLLALGILVDWFSFQYLDGSRSSTKFFYLWPANETSTVMSLFFIVLSIVANQEQFSRNKVCVHAILIFDFEFNLRYFVIYTP